MLIKELRGSSQGKFVAGSADNFWIWSADNGWDLTHPVSPNAKPIEPRVYLDCEVSNIVLDPAKTALLVIDMQNIALNPILDPENSPAMYEAQDQLVKYGIPAARTLGFQVIWLNWGLTEEDIRFITPAEVRVFGFKAHNNKPDYGLSDRKGDPNNPDNFLRGGEYLDISKIPGTELGKVTLDDGTCIDAGRAMMKGTWNTALYGSLASMYDEGKKNSRPDVWIDKNRNSGLWDADSQCSIYLREHNIRSLLFAGVNTDQCVIATLQDAHAKGFDTIMVKDGCATDSPGYAQECVEFNNVRNWGFLTSCQALAKAAGMDYGKQDRCSTTAMCFNRAIPRIQI